MNDFDKRVSDHLVRLVQIIFALVVAQSLVLYRDVIVHPLSQGHWLGALALGTVYVTTVLSWIDWHTTMEYSPYNFNPRNSVRFAEQLRLGADLVVVSIYAYQLFSIEAFVGSPASDEVWRFLIGFPAVFAAYAFSGVLRKAAHGPRASKLRPIAAFGLVYIALAYAYYEHASDWLRELGPLDIRYVNLAAVLTAFFLMLAYRILRWWLRKTDRERKESGLVIGVDVDGVLGNQIDGVLPRVKARLGVSICYEDVTDWALPIGESNIKDEIERAVLEDPDFVLKMPVHAGAREALEALFPRHRILVLTSRPPEVRESTRQWLERNRLSFDDIKSMADMRKSAWATDVLIDDYLGNVVEYLSNTNGIAILVDQPWESGSHDTRRVAGVRAAAHRRGHG